MNLNLIISWWLLKNKGFIISYCKKCIYVSLCEAWLHFKSTDFSQIISLFSIPILTSHMKSKNWCVSLAECVLSCFSCVWLFVTLWTIAHQALLSVGFLQARILEWVAMLFSRGPSQPRDRTCVFHFGRQVLTTSATWEAHWQNCVVKCQFLYPCH